MTLPDASRAGHTGVPPTPIRRPPLLALVVIVVAVALVLVGLLAVGA